MRESTVEKRVKEYAESLGWLSFKWVAPSNRGVPDRIFFRSGVLLLVEFKRPGAKPTKLQNYIAAKLAKHDFKVHVVDTIEGGFHLVELHTK